MSLAPNRTVSRSEMRARLQGAPSDQDAAAGAVVGWSSVAAALVSPGAGQCDGSERAVSRVDSGEADDHHRDEQHHPRGREPANEAARRARAHEPHDDRHEGQNVRPRRQSQISRQAGDQHDGDGDGEQDAKTDPRRLVPRRAVAFLGFHLANVATERWRSRRQTSAHGPATTSHTSGITALSGATDRLSVSSLTTISTRSFALSMTAQTPPEPAVPTQLPSSPFSEYQP